LIYITCSVFKEENEDQVKWLCDTFNLEIEKQELIKGYEVKADTMFVARLIKGVR
jgi:16S rRNA (cytosine967-C5)-methyltransferase